jgi:hypothetical protein
MEKVKVLLSTMDVAWLIWHYILMIVPVSWIPNRYWTTYSIVKTSTKPLPKVFSSIPSMDSVPFISSGE